MKLWYDDSREPPPGWKWARTNTQAQEWLQTGAVEEISLDHDMGLHLLDPRDLDDWDKIIAAVEAQTEEAPDGRELVDWMIANDCVPSKITIHSWNAEMAQEMARRLNDAGHDVTLATFRPRA